MQTNKMQEQIHSNTKRMREVKWCRTPIPWFWGVLNTVCCAEEEKEKKYKLYDMNSPKSESEIDTEMEGWMHGEEQMYYRKRHMV